LKPTNDARQEQGLREQALMRQIAHKNEAALEELYDRYATLLYSTILAIVKHPHEAEDVLQEVFLHIWNTAAQFDATRGNVYAWLITMTRNRAIDKLRSKHFKAHNNTLSDEYLLDHADTMAVPLDALIMTERAALVRSALENIPTEQATVLTMAYFQGHSQSEIAALLNVPLGTVKTRMRQGLQKLSRLLVPAQ
jgi:RNA polymerase sigma-70 factor, ECF subfamily